MQLELVKMLDSNDSAIEENAFYMLHRSTLKEETMLEIVKLLGKKKIIISFLCDEKYKNKLSEKVLIEIVKKFGVPESSDDANTVLNYHRPENVEAHKQIAYLLQNKDTSLRAHAITLLEFLKPKNPEVLNCIAQALTDPSKDMRRIAIRMIKGALQYPELAQNTELLKTINDAQQVWVKELLIPESQNNARDALKVIKPYEDAQLRLADLLTGDRTSLFIVHIKIILKAVEQPSPKLIKKLEEYSRNYTTKGAVAASEILATFKSLENH